MNRRYRTIYLQSAHWKRRRSRWFKKFGYYCRACGSRKRCDLHHYSYESLGDEPDGDLIGLCRAHCHPLAHRYYDSGRYKTRRAATLAAIASVKHGKRHESPLHELLRFLNPFRR